MSNTLEKAKAYGKRLLDADEGMDETIDILHQTYDLSQQDSDDLCNYLDSLDD